MVPPRTVILFSGAPTHVENRSPFYVHHVVASSPQQPIIAHRLKKSRRRSGMLTPELVAEILDLATVVLAVTQAVVTASPPISTPPSHGKNIFFNPAATPTSISIPTSPGTSPTASSGAPDSGPSGLGTTSWTPSGTPRISPACWPRPSSPSRYWTS